MLASACGHRQRASVGHMEDDRRTDRLRRRWDRMSGSYDGSMTRADRRFFGDTRQWVCAQASGDVLEVAIGTGLNLPHYPEGVRLTGVEFSPGMLAIARRRAADLGRAVDLREGDAHALDLPDGAYDTVVCTFALCAIPDDRKALAEMARVLRPGGLLLLADHVAAGPRVLRAVQWLVELVSVPAAGEYWRRRPIRHVEAMGFTVERHDRFRLGIVERLAARKPG
jgi:ubiquinone/menaquinone biosynthesis C-methylase UbiE